jgi:hypothetical protein
MLRVRLPRSAIDRRVASPVVSVQVWFAQDDASVRPGESASLALAIENVEDRTETYTIIPAGLTAAWTSVTRPNVTLFGGSRDVVEVVVRPPAIHSTSAGPTALAVRVIPQSRPDEAMVAETIIGVNAFDDRRITMLQPVQRARRRATFEFMVENHGNNLASCRLHLVDATRRVDGSFDPPAVGVAPGSSSLVRLKLRTRRSSFRRAERQLDFEVEAAEPDHDPAAGRATLIQPPTIPLRPAAQSLALAALALAVVAAWFGVIRPELREAADEAVEDRLGELQVGSTVPPAAATQSVTSVPATEVVGDPEVPEGEPVSYRIAVDAGVTQERSESLTVPPDARFEMTDLVLQNPNGDLGTAQLLRNGELLYTFNLSEMVSANEFQPRVSPLPFSPADNIVLSVNCEAAGQPAGTGCQIAVLMGGVLVPSA